MIFFGLRYNARMRTLPYFVFVGLFFVGVVALHIVAVTLSLYWYFEWFDKMMHFLGGGVAGSFGLWLFFVLLGRSPERKENAGFYTTAILTSLLIGVLWEVYELGIFSGAGFQYYDSVFGRWSIFDTFTDLVLDMLGGAFVAWYFPWFGREAVFSKKSSHI